MRNYKKINKIYYNLFLKDDIFKTPYFVIKKESKFYVFQDINSIEKCFDDIETALNYIRKIDIYNRIIILPIVENKND